MTVTATNTNSTIALPPSPALRLTAPAPPSRWRRRRSLCGTATGLPAGHRGIEPSGSADRLLGLHQPIRCTESDPRAGSDPEAAPRLVRHPRLRQPLHSPHIAHRPELRTPPPTAR